MSRRAIVFAACALSLGVGCAEIYGLGDYTEQDGGADVTVEAGGDVVAEAGGDVVAEAGGDAGNDAAGDAPNDVTPPSDGGCAGACVPPLPGGWTFVAYDQAFRPNCATNYGTPTDVEEGLSASPATCSCSCTVKPPCSNLLVTAGTNGACNNQNSETVTSDGGCVGLTTAITTSNESISVTPSGSGSCAADASVTLPPITYGSLGRICQLSTAPGGGCDGGACVPTPAPYTLCVYQSGVVSCPSGYPLQHVIGTSPSDTRGCTACTCDFDAGGSSCGGNAALFTGGACNATQQTVGADGACHSVSNQTFKSMTYQPTSNNASCTPSSSSPIGDAGFANPATVCCTQ